MLQNLRKYQGIWFANLVFLLSDLIIVSRKPPNPPAQAAGPRPLYRDWLGLSFRLLWCYDQAVRPQDAREAGRPVFENSRFRNNGAWLVRSGWAEVVHDGRTWRAKPGQWLIVRPAARLQRFAAGTRILSISFEAAWPDGTPWLDEGLSITLEAARHPALQAQAQPMARLAHRLLGGGPWDLRSVEIDARQFLSLQGRLAGWLSALAEALADEGIRPGPPGRLDERLLRAIRLIEAHPIERPLHGGDLARQCGMSAVHLNRLFRLHLGLSARAFFEKIRHRHALRQMASGVRPKETAHELGFVSLAHFSRWFRKHAGASPRECQAAAEGGPPS